MPGAYAHITLVNILREPQRLEQVPGFPEKAISAILDYFRFCELGAVSPDYPYLAVGDKRAEEWADTMHYTRTGEMIHAGVRYARGLKGETQRKVLAWLLGYAAHVTTDVTIHPVTEIKVGPYAQNKGAHRICEMHQDTYIFQRLNLGDIGLSEHLDSGVCGCGNAGKLDADIQAAWRSMLSNVHAADFKANPPDMDKWHQRFKLMVDDIGEEGNRLIPIARHIAAGQGLTYPAVSDIDFQYIKDLQVPGGRQDYDDIFNRAAENVANVWATVARGVLESEDACFARIGNWNLDTGRDDQNRLVFWS